MLETIFHWKRTFLAKGSKRWRFFVLINTRANGNIFRVKKSNISLTDIFFDSPCTWYQTNFSKRILEPFPFLYIIFSILSIVLEWNSDIKYIVYKLFWQQCNDSIPQKRLWSKQLQLNSKPGTTLNRQRLSNLLQYGTSWGIQDVPKKV